MDLMKQKATDDFMTYAVAVIKSRAIPLVEDGLKPVVRRILYAMGEMKLKPTGKTVKSAKVVGQVLGAYHPHGDASVYDAMVRLSQPWKMRYPLVEVQGNNGSLNGDPQAASRYTEAKLSEAGMAMLEDLDPTIVPFVPNYDDTTTEPAMLSGIFPNLLCNGTEGIAVGVSCSLPPHNLNNVIDLLEAHIKNRALTLNEAMPLIVGPDFPLGGIIVDGYKLRDIYSSGQGSITLRAKAEIELKTNSIKFSEFPYLVDVNRITKAMQDMVLEDGYTDILNYENHIGKETCFLRVLCAKGANLNKVINDLYEKTPLQKTIKINNTVIYNGVPITMSLLGLSNVYINHRDSCIIKLAKKEYDKQKQIAHIQKGLLMATVKIDDVVAVIRQSDSKEEARKKLISLLGVDSEQADAILTLQLGRLTRLDVNDIKVKIENAEKGMQEQTNTIGNREKRNEIMINDLERLRKKFGDSRRTTIIGDEPKEKSDELDKCFEEWIVVDGEGRTYNDANLANLNKSTIKGLPKLWMYNKGLPHYFFNTDGTVGEEWRPESRGIFLFDNSARYIVTISKGGIAKKTLMSEYKKIQRLCKVKDGDELMFAFCANDADSIVLRRTDNKVFKLLATDIKTSGKLTIGVKISSSPLTHAFVSNDLFYTVNSDNQVKKTEVKELTKTTVLLNNNCTYIGNCEPACYWSRGKFIEYDWNKVCLKGRTSDGAKISNSAILVS